MNDRLDEFNLVDRIKSAASSVAGQGRELKRNILRNRPNMDPDDLYDELVKEWNNIGSPTDSDEVIKMLKDKFGYAHADIMAAFKVAAKDEPLVKKLADHILIEWPQELINQLMQFLKDYGVHFNKNRDKNVNGHNVEYRGSRNNYFYDSVNHSGNMINEQDGGLSDEQIRDAIEGMFGDQTAQQQTVDPYFDKWQDNFSKQKDVDVKKKMVVDFVNKASTASNKTNKQHIDKIKSVITNDSDIKSDDKFYKNMAIKLQKGQAFTEDVNERVLEAKEMVMYGRRKKK